MIKVYQTIVDKDNGNCMQAVIASLFGLPLDDVPHFMKEESWFISLYRFAEKYGYEVQGSLYNRANGLINGTVFEKYNDRFNEIKEMDGVGGYFYGVVYSPKYHLLAEHRKDSVKHAVVIDKNFNIVHDPNPENQELKKYPYADEIGYNGITDILMINPK